MHFCLFWIGRILPDIALPSQGPLVGLFYHRAYLELPTGSPNRYPYLSVEWDLLLHWYLWSYLTLCASSPSFGVL